MGRVGAKRPAGSAEPKINWQPRTHKEKIELVKPGSFKFSFKTISFEAINKIFYR